MRPAGIELDDLTVLGPDLRAQAQVVAGGFAASWSPSCGSYPDGTRILELSTKCAPVGGVPVAAEARAFLAERGLNLAGEQQTKTKTALEFFSGQLKKDRGRNEMAQDERPGRDVLPIPDRPHVGLTTYDAKDPDTSFPPIEPLRPPAGAPNVWSSCSTTSASAPRAPSAARARRRTPSGWRRTG